MTCLCAKTSSPPDNHDVHLATQRTDGQALLFAHQSDLGIIMRACNNKKMAKPMACDIHTKKERQESYYTSSEQKPKTPSQHHVPHDEGVNSEDCI